MLKIKSYPAKNGDAFLVQSTNKDFAILIDGGYKDTFQKYIKIDLEALAASDVALDVVVATHVDADHIGGLLAFFEINGTSQSPALIPVHEVLHNSLRSLISPAVLESTTRLDDQSLLQDIRSRGYLIPDDIDNLNHEISAGQGNSLSQLLLDGAYQWNTYKGALPIGGDGIVDVQCNNAKLTILGPSKPRLDALLTWWTAQIRRMGLVGPIHELDDVFEYLCSREIVESDVQLLAFSEHDLGAGYLPDKSITNSSSISLIVEAEGCRLLFLGDCSAEDMVTALAPDGPTTFEAIKVAHHGSMHNTNVELLALMDSPHFFISTNGTGHNHPDFAVLKAIVDRPAEFSRTLHFNYSTPASQALKKYQSASGADFLVDEAPSDWVTINGLGKS